MTQETPAKVFSLLGVAMASMFMLFMVSASNASFARTEVSLPDPFAPGKVVAILDSVSSGYDQFLTAYLFKPAQADLAFYRDNAKWAIDQSADSVLAIAGLTDLASVQYYQNLDRAQQAPQVPRVAGAYTQRGYQEQGFSINSLYSLLIR